MHIGTFKFMTFALLLSIPVLPLRASENTLLPTRSDTVFAVGAPLPRRTCQTGLFRPRCTPLRPGLLGHFLDFVSPVELLREHGSLLTFRIVGAPKDILGRVPLLPADLLLENGQMLIFSSAPELEPGPDPLFFLFSFRFSFFRTGLFSLFLNISLHRFEPVVSRVNSDPKPGSGSFFCSVIKVSDEGDGSGAHSEALGSGLMERR